MQRFLLALISGGVYLAISCHDGNKGVLFLFVEFLLVGIFVGVFFTKWVLPNFIENLVFGLLGTNEKFQPHRDKSPKTRLDYLPPILLGFLFVLHLFYVLWNFKNWDQSFAMVASILAILLCVAYLTWLLAWISDPLAPEDNPILSNSAVSKIAQGDYEGAVIDFVALAETNKDAYSYVEAARICAEKLEDPNRALSILQHALEEHRNNPETHGNLTLRQAKILQDKGSWEEAKIRLRELIAQQPNTRFATAAEFVLQEVEVSQLTLHLREDIPG